MPHGYVSEGLIGSALRLARLGTIQAMSNRTAGLVFALASRDPVRRRSARWALLNKAARLLDMRVYMPDLDWWKRTEHTLAWEQFPATNHDVKDRRFVLYSMASSVENLSGDTAECGVYDGASSHLLCLTHQVGTATTHHAFDSFEGLSSPGSEDQPATGAAATWSKGDLSFGEDQARRNLRQFDFVEYHAGWIPERFAEVADRQFRFVHVDVDLYQPTRDSLEFFYPRLVSGGILLCDDYGFTTCPGARQAFDELAAEWGVGGVVELPTGQGFVVKP